MSKVLVIPDVHLKPEMFDFAEVILETGNADYAVQLGDLFDDWNKQFAIAAYIETAQRAIAFHEKFPKTLWCMGNHDFGYYKSEYGRRESGHSVLMETEMERQLQQMRESGISQEVAHVVDNAIFSHAGIATSWIERQKHLTACPEGSIIGVDDILRLANYAAPNELWSDKSPIWARLYPRTPGEQRSHYMFARHYQIVGHTPVETPQLDDNNHIFFLDTWSTHSDGNAYGDNSLCVIDTENPSEATTIIRYFNEAKTLRR